MGALKIKRLQYEFTRPADTTAYTAQDAVANSTSAPTICTFVPLNGDGSPEYNLTAGSSYQMKTFKLTKSDKSTTNASFDTYFYTSGVTATNDNAAHSLTYANKHVRIGKVASTLVTSDASTSTCAELVTVDTNLTFKALTTTIYAQIIATGAYTPASGEKFYLEVELLEIS